MLDLYLNSFAGADFVLHFIVGLLIAGAALKLMKKPDIGLVYAILIGLLKELWDFNNAHQIMQGSVLDLAITILGGLVAEILWGRLISTSH